MAACPPGQVQQCLAGVCLCVPQSLPEVSARSAALVLEQWLLASRDSALADARPVPPEIREQLRGVVEDAVLDAARFRLGGDDILNLANFNFRYGDLAGGRVAAVTLVDVIMFRDEAASANAALWVHELFHVQQFRTWGTREFARRYVDAPSAVEAPAYERQRHFASGRAGD